MAVVEYEAKDKIAYITLNRPDKLNAVNMELIEGLDNAVYNFNHDQDAWVAIVSGKGRAFCTGADLAGIGSGTASRIRSTDELYYNIMMAKKPMIAAVHGYCLAQGDGIALACDIVLAAEGTQFGWPQARRGISSTSGPSLGVFHLPIKVINELLFTARFVSTEEALSLHLINKIVPADKLMEEAEAVAKQIIANSPSAVWGMKQAMQYGRDVPIRQKMQIASNIGKQVSQTEDAQEGIKAFLEKRDPNFQGK
jgi:enoyl-CoA hydratase/carnithine racemase